LSFKARINLIRTIYLVSIIHCLAIYHKGHGYVDPEIGCVTSLSQFSVTQDVSQVYLSLV